MIVVFLISTALPQYQISNSVISSGGVAISNANYLFNSTIGEPVMGKSAGTLNQQLAGFWYAYHQQTITDVEDEEILPTVFNLEQNYPNPFNPSTKISWQSPVGSWQNLKVYDLLGREVTTLVDEYKPAGVYNVQFTINNLQLSSGVYFYQLKTGDPSTSSGQSFIQTKKMIYLK